MRTLQNLSAFARRFGEDRRGNVLIFTAFAAVGLCASLALAVDYGSVYYAKRKSQGAVDMAALASAQSIAGAHAVATESLSRNGFSSPDTLSVETGVYTASRDVPVGSRFTAGAAPANAVRVTMSNHTPLFFGPSVSGRESIALRSTAVAATSQLAKFSIGARVVSVESAVANAMLTRIFGSSVTLSSTDYDALAGDKIDVFRFSQALAQRLNLPSATFSELASASMTVGDVYEALVTLGRSGALGGASTAAIEGLAAVPGTTGVSLALAKLVDYGPYAPQPVADSPAATASVGLMDLVMAAAVVGNGTRQITLDLDATRSGLASAKATLSIAERTAESPWLSLGDADAIVRTAQTRLLLEAKVNGVDALADAAISLPVYVEMASGQARLSSVACSRDGTASTAVALAVLPGTAAMWLGSVSTTSMASFTGSPSVSPVAMVSQPLITVTGSGQAQGADGTEQIVTFSKAEIDALTVKSVSSGSTSTALVSSLLGNLSLEIQVTGSPGIDPVRAAMTASLTPALTPIDGLISSILGLTGIRLGQADVVVNGVRCDGAVLVQ